MTEDLMALYQKVVLAHSARPICEGTLEGPSQIYEGYNPICGDMVSVSLRVNFNEKIELKVNAKSCALCRASASVMASTVSGKAVEESLNTIKNFLGVINGEVSKVLEGDMEAFMIMNKFPARLKCVELPWKTLKNGLEKYQPTTQVTVRDLVSVKLNECLSV